MRAIPFGVVLLPFVLVLFGCAALPTVEPGSVMVAVLSDPPGAKVYIGHENTSKLLGTTPFTLTLRVPPEKRGSLHSERLTAVWNSGTASKRIFSWQPDRKQHQKFVFGLPAGLTADDLQFGLRHMATVGKTTPAMQAHNAHFGWERTKQMYADWMSLSAVALAAKYGSRSQDSTSSPQLSVIPQAKQPQPIAVEPAAVPLFRDIEVTNVFSREKYIGSVDHFGNASIRRHLDPLAPTFRGSLGSDGYGTFRDVNGTEIKVGPR